MTTPPTGGATGGVGSSSSPDSATKVHDSADQELAESIEHAVLASPAVAELDRGPFGAIVSYLPGRRLVGVSTEGPGEPVEVAVKLHVGNPIPAASADIRKRVRAVAGDVAVDIVVSDIVLPNDDTTDDTNGETTDGTGDKPAEQPGVSAVEHVHNSGSS